MAMTPPELPGNFDYPGERRGADQTYPFKSPPGNDSAENR
jgi:hypothetical protein